MRSDVPHFRGAASEDDEPRWEAYRALLQRSAASDLDAVPKARAEPRSFTLEEAERAYAEAGPGAVVETDAPRFETAKEVRDHESPGIAREAPIGERRAFAALASRSGRLVSATAAVTAGLVLAAAVFPRQQTEPAVIIWDHSHPVAPASSPQKTSAPSVHKTVAMETPSRQSRHVRSARSSYRAAPGATSHRCDAAKARAAEMQGPLDAKAQRRIRQACGADTALVTKPPIGEQTLNF